MTDNASGINRTPFCPARVQPKFWVMILPQSFNGKPQATVLVGKSSRLRLAVKRSEL
jgi:hypothetical protein